MASTSRWKCMVPLGLPVVPLVNAIRHTSSRLVGWAVYAPLCRAMRCSRPSGASLRNCTIRCKLAEWLAWPGVMQCCSSSASRLSHSAALTWALSMICANSPARSSGMVGTTTRPALSAPSKPAAIMGLLPPRSKMRLPGTRPMSWVSTWAMRWLLSCNCAYVQLKSPPPLLKSLTPCSAMRSPRPACTWRSTSSTAQLIWSG